MKIKYPYMSMMKSNDDGNIMVVYTGDGAGYAFNKNNHVIWKYYCPYIPINYKEKNENINLSNISRPAV